MTALVFEPSIRPDITPYLGVVRGKAREVARHFIGYTTTDDLVQDVALWWYSVDPRTLLTYLEDDGLSRLRRSIFRVARAAAEDARRSSGAYDSAFVQARYRPMEILQMIPVALDPEGVPDGGGVHDEGPKEPKGNLATGGEILAVMLDVRRALDELTGEDRGFIGRLNFLRWDYTAAAAELGVAPDSVRRRTARICERMARWLNEGPDGE